jgi:hypothetical protein
VVLTKHFKASEGKTLPAKDAKDLENNNEKNPAYSAWMEKKSQAAAEEAKELEQYQVVMKTWCKFWTF